MRVANYGLLFLGIIFLFVPVCLCMVEPRLLNQEGVHPEVIPDYQVHEHVEEESENVNAEQEQLLELNHQHGGPSFEHPEVVHPTIPLRAIVPARILPTPPTDNHTLPHPEVDNHPNIQPLQPSSSSSSISSSLRPSSTVSTSPLGNTPTLRSLDVHSSSTSSLGANSSGVSNTPSSVFQNLPEVSATCDIRCLLMRLQSSTTSTTLIAPSTTGEVSLPTQVHGIVLPEQRTVSSRTSTASSGSNPTTTARPTISTPTVWITLFTKTNSSSSNSTPPSTGYPSRRTSAKVVDLFPEGNSTTRIPEILVPFTTGLSSATTMIPTNAPGWTSSPHRAPSTLSWTSTTRRSSSTESDGPTRGPTRSMTSRPRPAMRSNATTPGMERIYPAMLNPPRNQTTTSSITRQMVSVTTRQTSPPETPTTTRLSAGPPGTSFSHEVTTQSTAPTTKKFEKDKIKHTTTSMSTPITTSIRNTRNSSGPTASSSSPTTTMRRRIHHNQSQYNRTSTRQTTTAGFITTMNKTPLHTTTTTRKPRDGESNGTLNTSKGKPVSSPSISLSTSGSQSTTNSVFTSITNSTPSPLSTETTESNATIFIANVTSVSPATRETLNHTSNATYVPDGKILQHNTESPRPSTTKRSIPPVFLTIYLRMSWSMFCVNLEAFQREVVDILEENFKDSFQEHQIMILEEQKKYCVQPWAVAEEEFIDVRLYIADYDGEYDSSLTVDCAHYIKRGFPEESFFKDKLVKVTLNTADEQHKPVEHATRRPSFVQQDDSGIKVAVTIATVGGICCLSVIILQLMMRKRYRKTRALHTRRRFSVTSTGSIALASVKTRPNSGLINPALDVVDIHRFFNHNGVLSNPVNFAGLANLCQDLESIYEEFYVISNEMPRLSTVPIGAEDKNRYANVIPIPRTRVILKRKPSQSTSDYINANFVTGYPDESRAFIATQAPLRHTTADFWRMVWEQQSRVIVMLTAMDEHGHPKCIGYWPEYQDSLIRYGDYTVVLKKRDVTQEFIMSTLELKDIENNLLREVKHIWYTSWPVNGLPEPASLVKFTFDIRRFYEDSGGPLVVHCSPGTGRTGTLLAIDSCMRQYETERVADVLNCVSKMRKERAGAVQTKEQYAIIYQALNEYAIYLNSPSISAASSVMTLHAIH